MPHCLTKQRQGREAAPDAGVDDVMGCSKACKNAGRDAILQGLPDCEWPAIQDCLHGSRHCRNAALSGEVEGCPQCSTDCRNAGWDAIQD